MTNSDNDREWWTQQWMDLINSYRYKKRLERAWKYAREGNVISFEFQGQKVISRVKGTADEPYEVSLWLSTFSDEDWGYVIGTMADKAVFSAKLLSGEMPRDIEEVFAANGLRLFPFTLDELRSRCSCPDKANPCKHISAVYYLLGDQFGDDPFMIFQMRGRTKSQILAELRQLRGQNEAELTTDITAKNSNNRDIYQPILRGGNSDLIRNFWKFDRPLEPTLAVIVPPPSSETVLDILGPLPVGSEINKSGSMAEEVTISMRQLYQEVSQQAILTALSRED